MKKAISVIIVAVSFSLLTSFVSCNKTDENNQMGLQNVPSKETAVYSFDDYNMINDALTNSKSSDIGRQMKREKIYYGEYYAEMLSKFESGKIKLLVPEYNGKLSELRKKEGLSSISLLTKELFGLPWIWYHCVINDKNYQVKVTYPEIVDIDLKNAKSYLEVVSIIYPDSPKPDNYTKYPSYKSVYEKEYTFCDGTTVLALFGELNDDTTVYVRFYLYGAMIVVQCDSSLVAEDFFKSFKISEY